MAGGSVPTEWTRAHIVTPFINALQGFVVIGVGLVAVLSQDQGQGESPRLSPFLTPVILAAGALIVALAFWAWRVNEYRIGDDAVYQRKGIVFKQHRQARLDRLQAVDVVQPLLARVFGFAELRVEVAGGLGSTVVMRFLTLDDAEGLRNEVLALASGYKAERAGREGMVPPPPGTPAEPQGGWAAPGPDALVERDTRPGAEMSLPRPQAVAAVEREVYSVPFGRLIGSVVFSWAFIMVILVSALIATVAAWSVSAADSSSGFESSQPGGEAMGAIFAILGLLGILWGTLNLHGNFKAGIAADGVRLSHGLLATRKQTVPPGRVQALNIKQSLLWRGFDWWKITVNVAGYQDQREVATTLLPVGTRQEALNALWLVLPDLGDPDPAGTVSTAMHGLGWDNGFTASPARSWIFDPFQWRRRGVKATDRALLIRRGLFMREFFVVPHERTQSLSIRQGPLQRALRLATIEVHSTRGVVRPVISHLDLEDAKVLIDEQAVRAREGRRRQTPEQWMEAVLR